MIFPGMDPYLEDPQLWPDFHNTFLVELRKQLLPHLGTKYIVTLGQRTVLQTSAAPRSVLPDAAVRSRKPKAARLRRQAAAAVLTPPVKVTAPAEEVVENFVEIRQPPPDRRLVTVIELLSPTNKYAGPGRELYLEKQQETFWGNAHLVEVDLLRTGPHVMAVPKQVLPTPRDYDYLACVNRWPHRRDFELYPMALREPLPVIAVPLKLGDDDVPLALQTVLERTYEDSAFALQIDYAQPCHPPLSPHDRAWAERILRKKSAIR